MHTIRIARWLAMVLIASTLVVGGAVPAGAESGTKAGAATTTPLEKLREKAEKALEKARQSRGAERGRSAPPVTDLKGSVTAVDPAAGTFTLQLGGPDKARTATIHLGTPSYVTLNGKPATLADVKVGDHARSIGFTDPATNHVVAYLALFNRTPPPSPAPSHLEGRVAAVDIAASSFVVAGRAATDSVTVFLGTPSIVTLNEQPATLADIKVNDRVGATTVTDPATGKVVAYVATFSRRLPPAAAPVRVEGSVTSVTPASNTFTVTTKGAPVVLTLASPAIVSLDGAAATLADVHVNDRAHVVGITTGSGLVAYVAAFTR